MGPWWHSQINGPGDHIGALKWKEDTAAWFRREVLLPFFDTYLRDRKPAHPTPNVIIYNPAEDHWDRFATWPGATADQLTPIYLQGAGSLSFAKPTGGEDSYVSDPAKPAVSEVSRRR